MTQPNKPAKQPRAKYGNSDEVSKDESALLETPVGREQDAGAADIGASFQEGRSRVPAAADEGSGDRETVDGLNETEESLRHAAEDVPSGGRP